jgi:F420-non-reducing hydrogenase iron-sulfur subunit
MCSGRMDLSFIFKCLLKGCDGVLICACKLGECNYVTQGNYHAKNLVNLCQKIMEYAGINPERLKIEFMSAAEGNKFAETVEKFTNSIKNIGEIGKPENIDKDELKSKIDKIMTLIPYIKIAMREKLASHNAEFTKEEIEELFNTIPSYYIDPKKCQACGTCARRCPVDAINGGKNLIHIIDQNKCIKCGTCYNSCPPKFSAIKKLVGEEVPPPISEEKRVIDRKKPKKETT